MAFGCFVADPVTGVPCDGAGQCGDELRCIAGFCKPASCAEDPKCEPFKAPCAKNDDQPCADFGSHGCFYAEQEESAGYCAYTCEETEQCPSGEEGAQAAPRCAQAEIGDEHRAIGFCVLVCSDGKSCPTDMHCVDVMMVEGPLSICLSGGAG